MHNRQKLGKHFQESFHFSFPHFPKCLLLYGKNQQILVSSKHKMVTTNRKGARKGAK